MVIIEALFVSCNNNSPLSHSQNKAPLYKRQSHILIVPGSISMDSVVEANLNNPNLNRDVLLPNDTSIFADDHNNIYTIPIYSPSEILNITASGLSCIKPDIFDIIEQSELLEIPATDIIPFYEELINEYGTNAQISYLSSNYFIVPSTFLYIINFPGGGYALFSPDKRLQNGLMFYSDNGHLSQESFLYSNLYLPSDSIFPHTPDYWPYYLMLIDSLRHHMFDEVDDGTNTFTITIKSNELFQITNYILSYCTETSSLPLPDHEANYHCNIIRQTYTDSILHWHQSEPFNSFCFPNLTGSIPLSIVKALTYLNYEGDILNNYFSSSDYKNEENMVDLYRHLYSIGQYVENYYTRTNTIGNTNLGVQLLRNILGQDNVEIFDFDSWMLNDNLILYLQDGDLVIRIVDRQWEILDGITLVESNCPPSHAHPTYLFYTSDRSEYTFVMSSVSFQSIWDSRPIDYDFGYHYKFVIIHPQS